jgi:NAD(P)-dependent dehydrogenase (short-subunit alcohol dehydrogenase family)
MGAFAGRVAIVTGGASGIGRALGEELGRRGAEVILADLNGERAATVAGEIARAGGRAKGVALDVRDAAAVRTLVNDTVARFGRIDYLFNNAGIAINGEARDLALADWKSVLDVNLGGVVHGVAAAYPAMLAHGGGHIVNTASAAGLLPAPGLTPYSASKHAVVGLSLSLRAEAADLGVRVSVVCPGFIDTPIIHDSRYVKLDRERMVANVAPHMMRPDRAARVILDGVERNRPLILVTGLAHALWWLYRIAPSLVWWFARFMMRKTRRESRID